MNKFFYANRGTTAFFLIFGIEDTLRNMMADEKATEKLLATLIAVNQLNTTKLTKINAA
ncbi:MAG: hypothetical protein LBG96_18115 [Tannerella sp.]|jgi:hypothetical protein|nr:hypothetical protein [Tannerella sp.]